MSSGDQQNITTSSKLNNDATATSRPLYIARNSVRGPAIYQFDMRYTRTLGTYFERVSPKLLVEGNNIFNHSNVTALNATATVVPTTVTTTNGVTTINATAGTITTQPTLLPLSTVLEARILQFGLKIDF